MILMLLILIPSPPVPVEPFPLGRWTIDWPGIPKGVEAEFFDDGTYRCPAWNGKTWCMIGGVLFTDESAGIYGFKINERSLEGWAWNTRQLTVDITDDNKTKTKFTRRK